MEPKICGKCNKGTVIINFKWNRNSTETSISKCDSCKYQYGIKEYYAAELKSRNTIEIQRNIASTVYINTPETSWGLFIFSKNGDLFLSSDWGSYTHRWRGFGDDFENFLRGLTVEYFVSKISISDVNQYRTNGIQKAKLTLLVGHFIEALRNEKLPLCIAATKSE